MLSTHGGMTVSFPVEMPKTAREAMRYFHAVALDYIIDLKKQFPSHDISVTPTELSNTDRLRIEIRIWDRTLRIEFEVFETLKSDPGLGWRYLGTGIITGPGQAYVRLIVPFPEDEWKYCTPDNQFTKLDAEFLLERMKPLLSQRLG